MKPNSLCVKKWRSDFVAVEQSAALPISCNREPIAAHDPPAVNESA